MFKFTFRDFVESTYDNWKKCGEFHNAPLWVASVEKIGIDNLTREDWDRITSTSKYYAFPKCSECGLQRDELVFIGSLLDDSNPSAYVCRPCVVQALLLLSG